MQPAVVVDGAQSHTSDMCNAVSFPASIAEFCHSAAQSVPSVCTPVKLSTQHNQVQHAPGTALHPAPSQDSVKRVHSCSAFTIHHSSYTGRRIETRCDIPTVSSRNTDGDRHVVTATASQQARAAIRSDQQWYDSQAPQPSLLSFDSVLPGRSSNSVTTQLQPRAFSISHPPSHPSLTPTDPLRNQSTAAAAAAAAAAGRQQECSAMETLRPNSRDSESGDSALSVDVSKISFRILTSGNGWAGQRGPCSPLTPIPDSPSSPLYWCR